MTGQKKIELKTTRHGSYYLVVNDKPISVYVPENYYNSSYETILELCEALELEVIETTISDEEDEKLLEKL